MIFCRLTKLLLCVSLVFMVTTITKSINISETVKCKNITEDITCNCTFNHSMEERLLHCELQWRSTNITAEIKQKFKTVDESETNILTQALLDTRGEKRWSFNDTFTSTSQEYKNMSNLSLQQLMDDIRVKFISNNEAEIDPPTDTDQGSGSSKSSTQESTPPITIGKSNSHHGNRSGGKSENKKVERPPSTDQFASFSDELYCIEDVLKIESLSLNRSLCYNTNEVEVVSLWPWYNSSQIYLLDNNEFGFVVESLIVKNAPAKSKDISVAFRLFQLSQENANAISDVTQVGIDYSGKELVPSLPMLSIAAYNKTTEEQLQARVKFSLPITDSLSRKPKAHERFYKSEFECGFYNTTTGKVSTAGCVTTVNRGKITCDCDHTTAFALLFSFSKTDIPPGTDLMSYVVQGISVVALVLTLAIFMLVHERVKSDRIAIQIGLTLSLLLLHLVTLCEAFALTYAWTCELATCLTHYFLLSSTFWTLLEGVVLFFKTSDKALRFDKFLSKSPNAYKYVIGWVLPALVVVPCAIAGLNNGTYMYSPLQSNTTSNKYYYTCWLNKDTNFLPYSVLLPIGLILLINTIIAIKVGIFVFVMSRKMAVIKTEGKWSKKYRKHVTASFKALLMLFPVLGGTMILAIFGSFSKGHWLYVVILIHGLQGLFLFLVYCVFSTEVRVVLVRILKRNIDRNNSFNNFSLTPR